MKYRNPKTIMQEIYSLLDELGGALITNKDFKNKPILKGHQKSGITESIIDLIHNDFFNEPRNLSEIRNTLRSLGIIKPSSALMKPLLRLVRRRVLRREIIDGKWHYQRH